MDQNHFVKSHALGNDYIVVDPQVLSFPLTERAIRLLCDRHLGVGSDGILAFTPSSRADFGLRIFARYLYDHGRTTKTRFTVETPGGLVKIELHLHRGTVERIAVEMGMV